MMIWSFVMYPVYQNHVFLLGVISYTRDYDPSFDTPEIYLVPSVRLELTLNRF